MNDLFCCQTLNVDSGSRQMKCCGSHIRYKMILLSLVLGRLKIAIHNSFSAICCFVWCQTQSKKLHTPHIWYQMKEEVVFFKMKTPCDCQFLFVFEIELLFGLSMKMLI